MENINVHASPLPFSNLRIERAYPKGTPIALMVADIVPQRFGNSVGVIAMVDGKVVPKRRWQDTEPEVGSVVSFRVIPQGGGGGKNTLSLILTIAVVIAAPYAAAAYAGAAAGAVFGTAATAGQILATQGVLTAAFSVVGQLAISALVPPPKSSQAATNPSESQTQFIEGARNSSNPYGVVPVNLGTNRVFALICARNYTESFGNENYVRQLFTWGFGQHIELSEIKIGDSLINTYSDYEIEHRLNGDLHLGTDLYTDSVRQENMSVLLEQSTGYVSRAVATGSDEATIDITFNTGLANYDNKWSARDPRRVDFSVQYAVAGVEPPVWVNAGTPFMNAASQEALTLSHRIVFPSRGDYLIRVARTTPDSTTDKIIDKAYLSVIRGIAYTDPVLLEGINGTAIRIRASNQLNGAIDQINALVSTHMPDYDSATGTWIVRATSNPASIYRYVMQGYPNARPLRDDQINIAALEAWHRYCAQKGLTYNRVIDYDTSVDELLRDIGTSGFATPDIVDGLRTIVIDNEKPDPVQVITPRNSWNYSAEMTYPQLPHAFRVNFRNAANGYQQDERIVYDTGYNASNATIFETLDMQFGTNPDVAWKMGRRMLATARLRPETHAFNMDIENLVSLRGDRIRLEHDVPMIGLGDGRIKDILQDSEGRIIGLTLDDTVSIATNNPVYIRVRHANGTMSYREIVPFTFDGTFDACIVESQGMSGLSEGPLAPDGFTHIYEVALEDGGYIRIGGHDGETIFNAIGEQVITYSYFIQVESDSDVLTFGPRGTAYGTDDAAMATFDVSDMVATSKGSLVKDVKVRSLGSNLYQVSLTVEALITAEDTLLELRNDNGSLASVGFWGVYAEYSINGISTIERNFTRTFMFREAFVDDTNAYEVDDLCYVVEGGGEVDLLIKSIEPMDDLTAKITCVDYAPAIFNSDIGDIPPFLTNITLPLELQRPIAPVLIQVQSDEGVMLRNPDGSFISRVVITLNNQNVPAVITDVRVRQTGTTTWLSANVFEASADRVILTGLSDGIRYDIWVRYQYQGGSVFSLPLQINNYQVVGQTGVPADVQNFRIDVSGQTAVLRWDANTEVDISHYIIKFSSLFSGATWGNAQVLYDNVLQNNITIPFQGGTYLIKAVDRVGNMSDNAAVIITYDPGIIANAVEILVEQPAFSGAKDNVLLDGDAIILDDTSTGVGYYYFANDLTLDGLYTSFVSAAIVAGGTFVGTGGNNIFDMSDLFEVSDIFGVDSGSWSVELEYRVTDSDPEGTGVIWSEWQPFSAGNLEFWAIEFRLRLNSTELNVTPVVTVLEVTVDMPDRIERGEDMTVPASGIVVTYDPPYRSNPAVAITIQDGDANDEIQFVSKTAEGFEFRVWNTTTSTFVERVFDYIASGYGRRNT